jgi:hypothetical protein
VEIEIDLIDACNLSCPLCNRSKHSSKDKYMPLDAWIDIIDLHNPSTIYFIGTRSEHTLYPEFIELCKHIKSKNINIVLSTNGCTRTTKWWKELSEVLNCNDEVRFAIDGITQEVYEKYRVGGSLQRVLDNHKAFGSGIIQYIEFDHNKHEDITEFVKMFDGVRIINSSQSDTDIRPRDAVNKTYDILNNIDKDVIVCETKDKMVFVNYNGDTSPCCHYNEHLVLKGHEWNKGYEEIENGDYDFCKIICGKRSSLIRKHLNIEL